MTPGPRRSGVLTLHGDNDLVHGHGVLLDAALVGAGVALLQVGQADGGVALPRVGLHEGHAVPQPRANAVVHVVVLVGQELGARGDGGVSAAPAGRGAS